MSTVLVTGANGFVGKVACSRLSERGHGVRQALRAPDLAGVAGADIAPIGDIGAMQDWSAALDGMDAVLHLAGRAHAIPGPGDEAAYYRTNVAGTENLARAAAAAGVRRLVYVSSIKVNGEATAQRPFRETDLPRPEDAYGRSKFEAEQRLRAISAATGLEIVIVRPPLVYGPGVKGNLARLLQLVDRGIPLPLGAIDNRRSLIGVHNLVDALCTCIEHPDAAGETFLVSDGTDLSTPALVRTVAAALNRRARLIPVPAWMLTLAARVTRSEALARLTGSLEVDSTHLRTKLSWQPAYPIDGEMAGMARYYRASTEARRALPL
jgi:nucleoside-diphosphate-sugar epimerase